MQLAFNLGGTTESIFRPKQFRRKVLFLFGGIKMERKRIVVKIGSSSLTNVKGEIDQQNL